MPREKKGRKKYNLTLPPELIDWIKSESEEERTTQSDFIEYRLKVTKGLTRETIEILFASAEHYEVEPGEIIEDSTSELTDWRTDAATRD